MKMHGSRALNISMKEVNETSYIFVCLFIQSELPFPLIIDVWFTGYF